MDVVGSSEVHKKNTAVSYGLRIWDQLRLSTIIFKFQGRFEISD
jgi:hypothetical protein